MNHAPARHAIEAANGDVGLHGLVRKQAELAPLLGEQHHPRLARGRRRRRRVELIVDGDSTLDAVLERADQRQEQIGAAGADQSREPDDLAASDRERHVAQAIASRPPVITNRQVLDPQPLLGIAGYRHERWPLDVAADHQAHQFRLGNSRGIASSHTLAVTKHGDPVGQPQHLVESMGDVDDGDTAGGKLRDHRLQARDIRRAERRRRFVHDDQPRIERQRPGNGHHLALAGVELPDRHVLQRRLAKRRQRRGRARGEGCAIEKTQARARLMAETHVLAGGERADQQQFLWDDGNAPGNSLAGSCESRLVPVEAKRTVIAGDLARENPDERGLAGAVLADQCVDFAALDREVHVLECAHAGKGHPDAGSLEEWSRLHRRQWATRRSRDIIAVPPRPK